MEKYRAERVRWTDEEESIMLEAIENRKVTHKNLCIKDLCMKTESLFIKYTQNPKSINNKLASLQNVPKVYKKRCLWMFEEEEILRTVVKSSLLTGKKISYKMLSELHPGLEEKHSRKTHILQNKVTSIKKQLKDDLF